MFPMRALYIVAATLAVFAVLMYTLGGHHRGDSPSLPDAASSDGSSSPDGSSAPQAVVSSCDVYESGRDVRVTITSTYGDDACQTWIQKSSNSVTFWTE